MYILYVCNHKKARSKEQLSYTLYSFFLFCRVKVDIIVGVGFIITSTGGSGLSVSYVGLLATKRVWKYSSKECDDSDDSSYDTSQFSSGRQTRLVEDFFFKTNLGIFFFYKFKNKKSFLLFTSGFNVLHPLLHLRNNIRIRPHLRFLKSKRK